MKVAFKTFGCRANQVDTDILTFEAEKMGFEVVPVDEIADAYLINSCTVTLNAEKDARVSLSRLKRQNPHAVLAVIGCYGQTGKKELLEWGVDVVWGTANKTDVLQVIHHTWKEKQDNLTQENPSHDEPRSDYVKEATGFLSSTFLGSRYARANIKIQDGCNFKCSFCIIPTARGRSRSLPQDVVVRQIEDAYESGFKEVILTGIHLAHYGWDCGTDLMTLLNSLLEKTNGPRIRLSTLDPFEIPDEMVEQLDHPRFCPHFHIALQSGSDAILRRMKRIYQAKSFERVTEKIRHRRQDAFIGVDIIVGFPAETDREFDETLKCLTETPWTKLHVFPYSLRPGTVASTMEGRVPASVTRERSMALRNLSESRYINFLQSQIGTLHDVLLETASEEENHTLWKGHTENYIPVSFFDTAKAREIRTVRLTEVNEDRMRGILA